jgi:hypothetical protein
VTTPSGGETRHALHEGAEAYVKAVVRVFDRMDGEQKIQERAGGPRRQLQSLSDYEFDQVVAEVNIKLGTRLTIPLLTVAAQRFGWPIPLEHRHAVAALLGLALQMTGDRDVQ